MDKSKYIPYPDYPLECELVFKHASMPVNIPFRFDYVLVPYTASDGNEVFFIVSLNTELKVNSCVAGVFADKESALFALDMLRKSNIHTIESEVRKFEVKK